MDPEQNMLISCAATHHDFINSLCLEQIWQSEGCSLACNEIVEHRQQQESEGHQTKRNSNIFYFTVNLVMNDKAWCVCVCICTCERMACVCAAKT